MKEQIPDYVKHIIERNGVKTNFDIEMLCKHVELLDERKAFLFKKEGIINNYQPVFSIHQRFWNK